MARTPPGPRSLLPGRLLRTLQRDPIPLFTRLARDYGDASMFSVLGQKIVFFNHPDLVAELLVAQNRFFHKSRVLQRSKIVFGEGLLTSEDPLHLRQRRLARPAFHGERIARYAEAMVACAARTRERWRGRRDARRPPRDDAAHARRRGEDAVRRRRRRRGGRDRRRAHAARRPLSAADESRRAAAAKAAHRAVDAPLPPRRVAAG